MKILNTVNVEQNLLSFFLSEVIKRPRHRISSPPRKIHLNVFIENVRSELCRKCLTMLTPYLRKNKQINKDLPHFSCIDIVIINNRIIYSNCCNCVQDVSETTLKEITQITSGGLRWIFTRCYTCLSTLISLNYI